MRTFIALDLPKEVVEEIEKIQKTIWKKTLFTGKLIERMNLHLTLKFLGEIDEEKVEEVKKILNKIKFNNFIAEIGEVGVFSKQRIRILWIKLNGSQNSRNFGTSKTKGFERKGIWDLQKQIDEMLKDMFPIEARFMSHITIARVKNVQDKKGLLDYLNSIKPKNIKFKIDSFSFKKSELLETGPIYEDLESYDLIDEKI